MERGNPTKEHLQALYGSIDGPFEGKDVFYSKEESDEIKEKGAAKWV